MCPNLREYRLEVLAVLAPGCVEHDEYIGVLLNADVKVTSI